MPFTLLELLLGIVVPALAALLLTLGAARLASVGALKFLLPVVLVASFLLGFWLLKLGPLIPKVTRDWVPFAALFALLPALVPGRKRPSLIIALLLLAAVCLLAAWLLVPNWAALRPARMQYLGLWSAYSLLLAGPMWLLGRRDTHEAHDSHPARGPFLWLALMIGTLAAAFVLLALSGSLRFAQIASAGMAALGGIAVGLWLSKPRPALAGVALVYALLISSLLLTGYVNSFSEIPLVSYLLLPFAPLAHWFTPRERVAQPLSVRAMIYPIADALVVASLAMGIAVYAEFS